MGNVGFRRFMAHRLGLLILFVCSACAQEPQDPTAGGNEGSFGSMVGDVDIRGQVVSENGEPLKDVTIKYSFREFGEVLINKEIEPKRMNADGNFRIKKKRITSIEISCLKNGYYPESWSFVFNPESPRNNPGGYEVFEIQLILQKKSAPVQLRKYEGILRAAIDGPVSVVGTKRQASGETWLLKDGQKREMEWPYVYLVSVEGEGSNLPSIEVNSESSGSVGKVLERGWLKFSNLGHGDGFVIYDPGEVGRWPETGMRRMNEAPVSGYVPNLQLSGAASPQTAYFYYRINGMYGKGMVTGRPIIAIEDDREVARAAILLYMNPTGSRNVSYIHN